VSTTTAIGDLTTLLAAHLDGALDPFNGARVTTLPLDRAQPGERQNRLNLYLSHVVTNSAFSNLPMPGTHPAANGRPPLAITLQYLVTFLGEDDLDEQATVAHKMLGSVMRLLLDQPELRRERIRALAPESFIDRQVDLVRLLGRPLTLEEISKLWPAFQTPYRLSIALEASCLLIESLDDSPTPMPVLRRGDADAGPEAVTGFPFPLIERLIVGAAARPLPAVRIGDEITVYGQRLLPGPGQVALLRVRDANGALIVDVPTRTGPAGALIAPILETYAGVPAPAWRAEAISVAVVIREPGADDLISNEVVVGLAPRITSVEPVAPATTVPVVRPLQVDANDPNSLIVRLGVAPPAFPRQAVDAWWGRQHLELETPIGAVPDGTLAFVLTRPAELALGVRSGPASLRLRVSRVDSLPVRPTTADDPGEPFELDPDTMVAVRWS